MRPPDFWARPGDLRARLLNPLGAAYGFAGRIRRRLVRSLRAPVPVICVGNLTVGGTGKTPVALALAERLLAMGHRPHFLTRGYGGRSRGPQKIDPARHDAADVGDEALLLAKVAPTWVARDRAAGARAAVSAGAGLLVMDDGFQNAALVQDLSLIVIDGEVGLGNRRLLPAGPLRESVSAGLARASAVVLVGADRTAVLRLLPPGLPVLLAELAYPHEATRLREERVVAFAGIGRPEKFFAGLAQVGAQVVAAHAFADHHRYRESELQALASEAERHGDARLVTTAKDHVRLPPAWRERVAILPVKLRWRDPAALERTLTILGPDASL
jgi:tetraacyldisaccharide 4'-kinase